MSRHQSGEMTNTPDLRPTPIRPFLANGRPDGLRLVEKPRSRIMMFMIVEADAGCAKDISRTGWQPWPWKPGGAVEECFARNGPESPAL